MEANIAPGADDATTPVHKLAGCPTDSYYHEGKNVECPAMRPRFRPQLRMRSDVPFLYRQATFPVIL